MQACSHLLYWLPTTSSTDCQLPASTLAVPDQPASYCLPVQATVHHVSLGSKRESVPQHQYPMPGSMPPDQAKPTTKQPASMHTCSPVMSPTMGRCLSSRNAQTVTPGRHHTQLLVAPWLTRLQPASALPTRLIMPDSDSPHPAKQTTTPMPSTGHQMPESSQWKQ